MCRSATGAYRGGRRRSQQPQTPAAYQVEADPTEAPEDTVDDFILSVNTVRKGAVKPYVAVVEVNGKPLKMEIDTGAAVTLISQKTQRKLFPNAILQKPTLTLRTYTAEAIRVIGQMTVTVKHHKFQGKKILYVVSGNGPSLLGRSWLSDIQLDWARITTIHLEDVKGEVDRLPKQYREVFRNTAGIMTHHTAHLSLKPGTQPVFRRAHSVPYALKEVVVGSPGGLPTDATRC